MHISEPEIPNFFWGRPHHPLRLLIFTQYCRLIPKILLLLHIFGKTLRPPLSKIPGSSPVLYPYQLEHPRIFSSVISRRFVFCFETGHYLLSGVGRRILIRVACVTDRIKSLSRNQLIIMSHSLPRPPLKQLLYYHALNTEDTIISCTPTKRETNQSMYAYL